LSHKIGLLVRLSADSYIIQKNAKPIPIMTSPTNIPNLNILQCKLQTSRIFGGLEPLSSSIAWRVMMFQT